MIGALAGGCIAGVPFIGISEFFLLLCKRRPNWKPMRAALTGMAARTAWMILALWWGLNWFEQGKLEFAAALMTIYLAAQVAEGIRYRRFAESRA